MSQPAGVRPGEAPPTYESIDGSGGERDTAPTSISGSQSQPHSTPHRQNSAHIEQDIAHEDRPLPPGWTPQYDAPHDRFFFVDTRRAGGPRSIWVHPLDDPEWLSTVPRGVDPLQHVENLWQDEPEPTPEPQQAGLPGQPKHGGIAQQLSEQATAQGYQSGPSYQEEAFGIHGPGVRQGNAQTMQQNFPGTTFMHNGQQVQRVTMDDLINYELAKMGSPEEYERNNPPGKVSSKMFHRKETPRQRQRRHAEARARDLADRYAYRAPVYDPMMRGGYPGYNRGYGGYGGMYPGMGLSAGMLGLGGGMLLGGLMF